MCRSEEFIWQSLLLDEHTIPVCLSCLRLIQGDQAYIVSQEALSVSKFVAKFLKSHAKVCPGLHLPEIQWIISPCGSDDFWEYSASKCDSSFQKQ